MPERITPQLLAVLAALVADPTQEWYGLELMDATALSSGTLYPILHRLVADGWLIRTRANSPSRRRGFRTPHVQADGTRCRASARSRREFSKEINASPQSTGAAWSAARMTSGLLFAAVIMLAVALLARDCGFVDGRRGQGCVRCLSPRPCPQGCSKAPIRRSLLSRNRSGLRNSPCLWSGPFVRSCSPVD